jgi:hypothetical protein
MEQATLARLLSDLQNSSLQKQDFQKPDSRLAVVLVARKPVPEPARQEWSNRAQHSESRPAWSWE